MDLKNNKMVKLYDHLEKIPTTVRALILSGNDLQQTTLRQDLFELCPEDLHQLYMKMHDEVPGAIMD